MEHAGHEKVYYCPESTKPRPHIGTFYADDIRGVPISCGQAILTNGAVIPVCPDHGVSFIKRPWKTTAEKLWDIQDKVFLRLQYNGLHIFKDKAPRGTAKCRMCDKKIAKDDPRIGFDWSMRANAQLNNGAFISRQRYYVHRTCLVDAMYDGKVGDGCPGCTARVADKEYQAYRKMIASR